MPATIKEVMHTNPVTVPANATMAQAAHLMRDNNIGDVIVEKGHKLFGIVTDRDLVVRGLAQDKDPSRTPVGDICTKDVATLRPDSSAEEAVAIIRDKAIRRVPVVDNGSIVGIVSIGDLAIRMDPTSALADLSAAPPTR
jgi:CBS domain-containing protein